MVARRERNYRGRGLALLIQENINFQKMLMDGPFKESIMESIIVGKDLHCGKLKKEIRSDLICAEG